MWDVGNGLLIGFFVDVNVYVVYLLNVGIIGLFGIMFDKLIVFVFDKCIVCVFVFVKGFVNELLLIFYMEVCCFYKFVW